MVGQGTDKIPQNMAALVDTAAEMALASLCPSTLASYQKIIDELKGFVANLDPSIQIFSGVLYAYSLIHVSLIS